MTFSSSSSRLLLVLLTSTTLVSTPLLAGTLSGNVVDSSGTASLQGAEVTIMELNRSVVVGSDGQFRFTDIAAGNYKLLVRYVGAEDKTLDVVVPETGEVKAEILLQSQDATTTTVLVIGQRANLLNAITRQKTADGVQTTLSKDSMGQFPDQNVAEAMRRATGVNVLNDQGEGRFVSVRGLDPNLNSASINGSRILSTGGDDRSVAMDVLPAELIESIDIKKSLTPDMDGDTIGASIEINTISAFDRKKNLLSASFEGSYNDLNDKTSPKAGLDFSYRINSQFGVAGGLSYYDRRFSTDNIEAADWDGNGAGGFARTLEYRDYDVTRERYGYTLNFDYRMSDDTSLYLRTFYSKFDDTELRRRLIFKIDDLNPTAANGIASFLSGSGTANRIEIRRDIKDRREWQETSNIAFGGKTFKDAWKFAYDISLSTASQSEDGSIDPMRFRARYSTGANQLGLRFDYNDLTRPSYTVTTGAAIFNDPTRYSMTAYERTVDESAEDKETTFRFDAARLYGLNSGSFELKFGYKMRGRDKSLDMTYDYFDGYDGTLSLADVSGSQSYGLANLGLVPDLAKVRQLVATNSANFERSALDTQIASQIEDYSGTEDIAASYIQGRFDNGALRIIGGARVEQTKVTMNGSEARTIDDDGDVSFVVTPVNFKKSYTDVLPSVNLRYNVSPKIVGRLAVSKSIMRPSFGKMAPRFVIEETFDGADTEIEAVFGNPDLNPYQATNLDASLEYYFAKEGVLQAGVFAKKIKDFIVDFSTDTAGTYKGVDYDAAEYAINGGEADVFGIELSYSQAFSFLPAPWDGLLMSANYTYTNAEGDVQGRVIPLPAAADQTANLVLGYEKGPWSLRAAGSYRSGYLDELGGDAEEDRYVKDHFQIDLSAKYRLNKNIRIFGEIVNANDATYTAYNNIGGAQRLLQYEEYGFTTKLGFKINY